MHWQKAWSDHPLYGLLARLRNALRQILSKCFLIIIKIMHTHKMAVQNQRIRTSRECRGHCGDPGRLIWGHECRMQRPGWAGRCMHICGVSLCLQCMYVHISLCVSRPVTVRGWLPSPARTWRFFSLFYYSERSLKAGDSTAAPQTRITSLFSFQRKML